MRQWPYFLLACVLITTGGFCAVIQQEDFTSGDNGTLPASLDAEWDAGVDVIVTDLTSLGVPSDHTGGDGYALQLGDLGAYGYNFAFTANFATDSYADNAVEAWVYFDFAGSTGERDYGLFIRCTPDPTPDASGKAVYGARAAYWFLVSVNSSWSGYAPPDYRPFLLKGVDVYADGWETPVPLAEGTSDYTDGWHKLRLEAVGTTIKGYVDDVLEVEVTDTTHATGCAGMMFYNASANDDEGGAFDNFLWETSVAPTPTPPGADVDVKSWTIYE